MTEEYYKYKAGFYLRVLFVALALILTLGGSLMNAIVMVENNGLMPVYFKPFHYQDESHITYSNSSQVNYPILSDYIYIKHNIFSPGDLIMFISFTSYLALSVNMFVYLWKNRRLEKYGK